MFRGPQDLDEESFNRECLRCGRTLSNNGEYCSTVSPSHSSPSDQHMWRWTGFNSGLDLIITYDKYRLSMKRNMESDHEALTSTQKKRHIAYR